jgi:hypothetical protein
MFILVVVAMAVVYFSGVYYAFTHGLPQDI